MPYSNSFSRGRTDEFLTGTYLPAALKTGKTFPIQNFQVHNTLSRTVDFVHCIHEPGRSLEHNIYEDQSQHRNRYDHIADTKHHENNEHFCSDIHKIELPYESLFL